MKFNLNLKWQNTNELKINFLIKVLGEFGDYLPEPLRQKQDLEAYAKKLLVFADIMFAFSGEQIVGILLLYANDNETGIAHIPVVSVSPAFRNLGIGEALLSRAVTRCRARRMNSLTLEVKKDNTNAIRFYEKHGFRIKGKSEKRLWMATDIVAPNNPLEISPTALEHHPRIAASLHLNIDLRIKRDDLYPMSGGGIKARKINYILQHAVREEYDVLVTNGGPQSNHARSTALEAARLGMRAHIIVVLDPCEAYMGTGNILVMRLSGATIEYCRKEELSNKMDEAISKYESAGNKPFYLWGGGHHISGTEAFVSAAEELQNQTLDWQPDYVVMASGTGSTQAGLAIGYAATHTKVIGISVAREATNGANVVKKCVKEYDDRYNTTTNASIEFYDDWTCGGYDKTTPELLELVRMTARLGILLDPTYSGKGWMGLHDLVRKNHIPAGSKVVFWHTGGLMNLQASQFAVAALPNLLG